MRDYNLYKYDEMFFVADEYIKQGKIVEALHLLENIIEEQPDYGKAHNHLGWLYETRYKDYKRAKEHYKAAIAFEPLYPAIYSNYAVLLSILNDYKELKSILSKALKVPGVNKASIHNEFGIMLEMQMKFDEAIKSYQQATLHSLHLKDIEMYQNAMNRCQLKKEVEAVSQS